MRFRLQIAHLHREQRKIDDDGGTVRFTWIRRSCLGACSPDPNGPDHSVRIADVEFADFAACVFEAMRRAWPMSVSRTDRRHEGVITVFYDTPGPFAGANIRPMEVTAKKISDTTTEVSVRVLANKHQAWARIEPCAAPNGYHKAEAVAYPVPVRA